MTKAILKTSSNDTFSINKGLMNRNWVGKLQVTLIFGYISWKKECLHSFKTSLEEVTMMCSEKMKAKYLKKVCVKVCVKGLADWPLTTSLRINFFMDSFQGFWLNEHLPMVICCFYTNSCEIVTVYAGWNPRTCRCNKQSPISVLW